MQKIAIDNQRALDKLSLEALTVVQCVANRHDAVSKVRALVSRGVNLDAAASIAEEHGVVPAFSRVLQQLPPCDVPVALRAKLLTATRANALRNHLLIGTTNELLEKLHRAGIEALIYKGPAVAAAVYSDLSLRFIGDIDLLVRRVDVEAAAEVIVEAGFEPIASIPTGADAARFLDRDCELGFKRGADGQLVELHWRFRPAYFELPLDIEQFWTRKAAVELGGCETFTLAPVDHLLVLCVHGAKHRWDRLRWICDIGEILRRDDFVDWDEVMRAARTAGCERVVTLAAYVAHTLLSAPLPVPVVRHVSPIIGRLSDYVMEELFHPNRGFRGVAKRALFNIGLRERPGTALRYIAGRVQWSAGERRLIASRRSQEGNGRK
ncbi:MAG: nucleotidyltransferase family protein [Capsulimonadaceae bacterium]|nr:nucleotidyltransferase family protein [Capsulimonadaceae bacterium]